MVLSSAGCKVPWALRGLCEADAAVATAYAGGIRHCETSAHAGRGNPFSPRMGTDSHVGLLRPPRNDRIPSARAAWIAAALCGKTTPWSSRSLPRKHSFHRPGEGGREKCALRSPFFKNYKTGTCHFLQNRLYCVQGKKKSDCFPPVAAGDLEAVVFYVRSFFPGPAALCGAIIWHPSFL